MQAASHAAGARCAAEAGNGGKPSNQREQPGPGVPFEKHAHKAEPDKGKGDMEALVV